MVNLNQPIRITTTRVLLVAGVGALMLLHKQAQHHAALPSHPHAFGAEYAAGLGTGVVELAGLADDDRAGADDQDGADVVALRHSLLSC